MQAVNREAMEEVKDGLWPFWGLLGVTFLAHMPVIFFFFFFSEDVMFTLNNTGPFVEKNK